MKVFNRWSVEGIEVKDPGLKKYISLQPSVVPRSRGKLAPRRFYKSKMFIVERLITKLMVPGHVGKKHVRTSGRCTGKTFTVYNIVRKAFERIEKETKKNPIEVLVRAVENAALREEIASYQLGGIIVRRAVVTSPQRRVDIALRQIAQAAYAKAFGKRTTMVDALATEIIGAHNNDSSVSLAIKERERIEREAEAAR